ncbi:helix-turn-helix domain-containing protein [Flavobacterium pallidum]|uniref:Transcriptional regulator n=1 Tax=Flavobacterium pallidum TaxID=2172098 RepID=A0A2S1SKH5_9FLAO|nr:helix-turn-helix transcriptional regulator [Flavobacterium pallidum]AWI26908.1 transcriptional regulator [Flavobacterium pallidum]
MLNTDDFIKRLELLMKHYELSASSFADKIGVQRSGISHLLSGRNKPSLDFILKLGEEFPDVNLYWLLKGSGAFLSGDENTPAATGEKNMAEEKIPSPSLPISQTGDIDKIIILYRDGSFMDYRPKSDK